MTKLEMAKDYQKRLRAYRKKKDREVDDAISKIYSKWVLFGGGGLFSLGLIAGKGI